MSPHPPATVLHAFGVDEPPRPLAGGQGRSWVSGGLVFKPDDGPVQEWLAEALSTVSSEGFRLARPARTAGCWHDADTSLLEEAGVRVAAVARALVFRMATTNQAALYGIPVDLEDEARRYERAASLIGL